LAGLSDDRVGTERLSFNLNSTSSYRQPTENGRRTREVWRLPLLVLLRDPGSLPNTYMNTVPSTQNLEEAPPVSEKRNSRARNLNTKPVWVWDRDALVSVSCRILLLSSSVCRKWLTMPCAQWRTNSSLPTRSTISTFRPLRPFPDLFTYFVIDWSKSSNIPERFLLSGMSMVKGTSIGYCRLSYE